MNKVLILDDQPYTVRSICDDLEKSGSHVEVVSQFRAFKERLSDSTDIRSLVVDLCLNSSDDEIIELTGLPLRRQDQYSAGLHVVKHLVDVLRDKGEASPPIVLTSARMMSAEELEQLAIFGQDYGQPINFVPKYRTSPDAFSLRDWLDQGPRGYGLEITSPLEGLRSERDRDTLRAVIERVEHWGAEAQAIIRQDPQLMHALSPRQFEEFIAHLLDRMGYDTQLTPPSNDGGYDIRAIRRGGVAPALLLVECKRYQMSDPVGVKAVRALQGSVDDHSATGGMLATTSYFTRGARAFEERHPFHIALNDFHAILRWL